MTDPQDTVLAAWEAYRASLSRERQTREALRQAIREAIAAGVGQSDIARLLGIPRQYVYQLLYGRRGRAR